MTEPIERFRAERRKLLEEGNRLNAFYQEVGYTTEGEDAIHRVFDLHDRYSELLPEVTVSRCPFTGELIRWPIDEIDLDGWFWNYDNPTRRLQERVPATWLSMGGAVRLSEPVAPAPFHRMPGPDTPYVVPRLLEFPEVCAVIAELPIGPHTGWAITYFSTRRQLGVPLENLWGSKKYDIYNDGGIWNAWAEHPQTRRDYDFDLGPWLDSGKLRWIAPGDTAATLREGATNCPYVGIEGTHQMQIIYDAEVTKY
ncbi:hypothetical protein ACQP1G_16575 [Nocardia sp. CA-107356]|uniref:hypothetical protein n=1 Tax=Nocardia sp. CA-107356 TaxID=3239972 RepID=UPI003D8B83ED